MSRSIRKIALLAVGDDAWMGGIQYIINIVHALNVWASREPIELHVFKHASQHLGDLNKFDKVGIKIIDIDETLAPFSFSNRVKWYAQRRWMGRIYPRLEDFLVQEEYDFVYPTLLSDCGGKLNSAAWIADFQYHHFPEGASTEATTAAEKLIGKIAQTAKKIVYSSHFCERDGYRLFPVTKGKSFVLPFTVYIDKDHLKEEHRQGLLERYGLPTDYLMVSNLFAKTKNHETLFNALGILKKRGKLVNLVCTGNIVDYRNHRFANDILKMLTENNIRSQVHLLGLVPRADQVALYRMARALVQPSVNEGWSTLVEEAKALGKQLLLSDIDLHKEQYPGNPFFFEAMNPESLANRIEELYQQPFHSFPDFQKEAKAQEEYHRQTLQFAEQFLSIAKA